MELYGIIWNYMELYGFIWIYMDLYGFNNKDTYIYTYIYIPGDLMVI